MLDPDWVFTRPLLWLALAALLALLVLRSVRKDRKEYQRFKRYRTTAKRQAMFRKWLLSSLLSFGGLSLGILLLTWQFIGPMLAEIENWPVMRAFRGLMNHEPGLIGGLIVGATIAVVGFTTLGIVFARKEKEVPTIGDIRSMLPRNRQELMLGGLLSINAGIVEELMFRLALPTLLFGTTGNALAAVLGSVLFFGALHAYQGIAGVIGTTVIGAVFMALFLLSGSIAVPIVLHALFDLRSLVLIPAAVYGVHKVDGVKHPFATLPRPVRETQVAETAPVPETAPAENPPTTPAP